MEIIYTTKLALFVLSLTTITHALESNPYDFSSSYFCSTCFTNNQDQNYHCCFYFFKCCGDARRGMKPSRTVSKYPPIPTQIAYIVKDKTLEACSCSKNNGETSVLCCLSWNTQTTTEKNYVKGSEFDGYVEQESTVKSSTEEVSRNLSSSGKNPDIDKPFNSAVGTNANPSNLDSNNLGKKLLIPPSFASGHEPFDTTSNKDGVSSRKLGWVTKDLLIYSDDLGK